MVLYRLPSVAGLARRKLLYRGVNSCWRVTGHHGGTTTPVAMSRADARHAAFSQSVWRRGDEKDKDPHYHHQHHRDPETAEPETFSQEFEGRIPSNRARPTLSDAYQHSGKDEKHPRRPAKEELPPEERKKQEETEESVKKHNAEVEVRYDRACAQVDKEGKVDILGREVRVDEKGRVKGK
ncbi:hypothetical protein AJ80_09463 [Polytolypa hystricis UAMH7299]|uniref:Uncharacterized protein n=1 Tax=Polytolypa hystricis (strain UAMH7299) TaxID=1447883 RepID=A0A2B7WQG5_POLH7|nr:hypothetical protein AJ80_09463 [Polytolypa hystricis UAMH7299]